MVDTVQIAEKKNFAMAAILARRGASVRMISEAMAADLPLGPSWIASDPLVMIGSGPGTWLAHRDCPTAGWVGALRERLAGIASVSDQSSAYRIFRIKGTEARALLQRGAAVDLDDLAFPPGSVAFTAIAYLDVIIRRLAETDGYELLVYRSSAESFVHWLETAADRL